MRFAEIEASEFQKAEGDILVVWQLDPLAWSMKQLIETVEDFENRGIGLKSLQNPIDELGKRKARLSHFCRAGRV